VQIRHQRNISAKIQKNIQKKVIIWMDFVCRANLIYPYFIYMIEGYFEKPKSLMTLMTVTLMTGKRP